MRRSILSLSAALLAGLTLTAAQANELERVAPVTNPTVLKECGACHLAYSPKFLSAETWTKITDNLSQHFGEDASLPDATRKVVQDFYVAGAGRSQSGLLRISEQSWWLREHRAIGQSKLAAAKSKANCAACHKEADKGLFED